MAALKNEVARLAKSLPHEVPRSLRFAARCRGRPPPALGGWPHSPARCWHWHARRGVPVSQERS
jgi:hypothetical protein